MKKYYVYNIEDSNEPIAEFETKQEAIDYVNINNASLGGNFLFYTECNF